MSDAQIIRPRLAFEREFGQHRNWWVRDARLAGNPLTILLYLLSHDPVRMPTQTEARQELELGTAAWQSGKRRLLEAGFLVEVRDRFPRNFLDAERRPRGGQKRFRLFLQDPEPGYTALESESLIELDEPYEEFIEATQTNHCGKSAVVEETPGQPDCGLSAVAEIPTADNPQSEENPQSFKEEKTRLGLVGYINSSHQPTNHTTREAEIDVEIAGLHPDLELTFSQIEREVNGRVDLAEVDVVEVVRDTVLKTAARGRKVRNPAALVAAVIVRNPANWPIGAGIPRPFNPNADGQDASVKPVPNCLSGNHWWGSEGWSEIDRSHCVDCGQPRREVDSVFAELEEQLLSIGGDR